MLGCITRINCAGKLKCKEASAAETGNNPVDVLFLEFHFGA